MKGWKTIVFNILMAVLLVVEQQGVNWGLSPEMIGFIAVIGNAILRLFTNTAVGSSVVGGRPGERN